MSAPRAVVRALAFACAVALALPGRGMAYEVNFLGGTVHGPGPMPDTPLPQGRLTDIKLDDRLSGVSEFFNNGDGEPHYPGELEIEGHFTGKLSNGVPFNKHTYGGVVTIGQGAMRMLNTITSGGEMQGRETYELDDRLNLVMRGDLALDPGFPEGITVTPKVRITSGVLIVPPSRQTEAGLPGGQDLSGSLPSGVPVYGWLGDRDGDGFLGGRIVGIGRPALTYIFVPGAPLVIEREMKTSVPITREEAGILTFAGLANLSRILATAGADATKPARAYVLAHAGQYLAEFAARAATAHKALAGSAAHAAEAEAAASVEATLRTQAAAAAGWAAAGAIPPANLADITAALDPVERALPALKAGLRFSLIRTEGKSP